ncbi:hypothetical protein [Edaphobacter aggregans]|uniref:hypothetical protein n=1 Tax=Edaphobacter aggregans TaxID=570835 RepID=UPI00054E436E|nr:hypothetical protein [Edaphobacter aggregans]
MTEQIEGSVAAGPTTEYSADWLAAKNTTPEQQETLAWSEERTRDLEAGVKLKTALNIDYHEYQKQIEGLEPAQRLDLADKSPEEIVAHLDDLAADERVRKQFEADIARVEAEQKEANAAAKETAQQSALRKNFTQATKDVATLDERIAELQRLNAMRDDLNDKGWDDLPTEQWVSAREGKLDGWNLEIANLIQEKQAKLQEAGLYQDGYHEASRANQPPAPQPIGQFNGMPLTQGDIQSMVQMERDGQAHQQRVTEAQSRYPDWNQAFQNHDIPMRNEHLAFIMSLPNSADVSYYLATHPNEAMPLLQMPNSDATRTLINISHKAKPAQAERRTTSAPKPPSPVSGAYSGTFDVNDDSGSADDWLRGRQADLRKKARY